jgi:hypothetical protein
MASWDRRSPASTAKLQSAALRSQVVDAVAPFSPWWRARLRDLGRTAQQVSTREGLAELPAAGERDVCSDGDPRDAAALVLQAGETGWALHAEGPRLRAALARRLTSPGSYAALVEADTRPTSFVWAGLGMRFPVASTRGDLDVVARAGARLWQVLGLTRADVAVSGLPLLPTAEVQALELGALGAGAPLLAPGDDVDDLAEALLLVPATVLALPAADAAEVLDALDEAGAALSELRTLLLVGAPDDDERARAADALTRAGVEAAVLGVHVPDGHRLAWAECREGDGRTGLHTYPDLELVEVVDAETGERGGAGGLSELVLTQLGLRGTALLRWRTGDVVDGVTSDPCPACGRTVPRVLGARRAALVPVLDLTEGAVAVDVRAVTGAVLGRSEVADWRVDLRPRPRDGADRLLVHIDVYRGHDAAALAVDVAQAVRAAAGLLPSQVVVHDDGALPGGTESGRLLLGG